MRSDTPKVLHRIGGRPMLAHVLERLAELSPPPAPLVVVVGKDAERVTTAARSAVPATVSDALRFATQHVRKGTAHALLQARGQCAGKAPTVLVVYGDVPLLSSATLGELVSMHVAGGAAVTLLTANVDDPSGYGRVVRSPGGDVARIVEDKDATAKEREIREINAGVYALDDDWLWPVLDTLETSTFGEIYLTDVVARAVSDGRRVVGLVAADPEEAAGINTAAELARAEAALAARAEITAAPDVERRRHGGLCR